MSAPCLDCGCPQPYHRRGRGTCSCGQCKRFRTTPPGEPHRTGAERAARRQEMAEAIATTSSPKGDPKP